MVNKSCNASDWSHASKLNRIDKSIEFNCLNTQLGVWDNQNVIALGVKNAHKNANSNGSHVSFKSMKYVENFYKRQKFISWSDHRTMSAECNLDAVTFLDTPSFKLSIINSEIACQIWNWHRAFRFGRRLYSLKPNLTLVSKFKLIKPPESMRWDQTQWYDKKNKNKSNVLATRKRQTGQKNEWIHWAGVKTNSGRNHQKFINRR